MSASSPGSHTLDKVSNKKYLNTTMKEPRKDYHERITQDPKIMLGKPVITGTRIPVSVILNLLDNGYDSARVREDYPDLTGEDISAAVAYSEALHQPGDSRSDAATG